MQDLLYNTNVIFHVSLYFGTTLLFWYFINLQDLLILKEHSILGPTLKYIVGNFICSYGSPMMS